ncbi:MAG: hypothetical protein WA194_05270 [Patescibacteria group bacterium]
MASNVLESHFGSPDPAELRAQTAQELDKMGSVDAFFDRLVKNYDLPAEYVATVKGDSNIRKEIAFALAENYGTTRGGLDALRIETMVKDRGIEYREALASLRTETSANIGAILGGTEAANDSQIEMAA